MLNKVILQGRIAKLNELKVTASQKTVVSFTLAVDRDFDREQCDFIPVVAWNKTADFIDKYTQKGQMILVVGRMQVREWTDDQDKRRTTTEVIAESVNFCGEKKREEKKEEPSNYQQEEIDDTPESRFSELNGDGELPF